MSIPATTAAQGTTGITPTAPADAGSSVMGKEDFLQLLVTQLSNQDPLNPMDGQQFAAQLAQFSSVEQLMNINESVVTQSEMSGLISQNINTSVAAGLIGKNIEAETNQVRLGEGDADLGFELDSNAAEVMVVIKNSTGQVVRTLEMTHIEKGKHDLTWDGKDHSGTEQPAGIYSFEIKATDGDDEAIGAAPRMSGRVDRATFGPEGIMVWMNEVPVPFGAVVSVQSGSDE